MVKIAGISGVRTTTPLIFCYFFISLIIYQFLTLLIFLLPRLMYRLAQPVCQFCEEHGASYRQGNGSFYILIQYHLRPWSCVFKSELRSSASLILFSVFLSSNPSVPSDRAASALLRATSTVAFSSLSARFSVGSEQASVAVMDCAGWLALESVC